MFSVVRLRSVTVLLLTLAPVHAWADRVVAPIERFYQVDSRLYRGAQPDTAGLRYLRDLGVTTVVNLRQPKDAERLNERNAVESLGMRYVNIAIEDGSFLTRSRRIPVDAIRSFFEIIDAADSGVVFVHCRRGADRTGALVSFYRIARHHWDAARAYGEARSIGMRSWYRGLQQQIEEFARQSRPALGSSSQP